MPYFPERGDVVLLSFAMPEEKRTVRRQVVVLSPREYNVRSSLVLVCPIVGEAKGYPFEVVLPAGLDVQGVILADQVKTMDWRKRRAAFVTRLPPSIVYDILGRLNRLLQF